MAEWKVSHHGASEAFLRSLLGTKEDACIPWPYCLNGRGYGLAVVDGKQRGAHHWMCRLAHGAPFSIWRYAAHSCGNPQCVNPNHLRWATPAENAADRKVHGTDNSGERNGRTTLTEADVRAIRAAPPFYAPLMEKYGLSRHGISKIRSGKRWQHLDTSPAEKIGSHSACRNGHLYDEANTRWSHGYRQCRACDRELARAARARKKADENCVRWSQEEKAA
jgi:hypothetical protein